MSVPADEIPEELKARYSDFHFLGSGAMGRVYQANDIVLLKSVAIKLLLKNQTPETAVRFQREAQTASRLRHPNLVSIMNFGSTDGDQLYLVMEYANGRSLSSVIEKKPLSLKDTISIISQVCDGMSHAHSLGVIHRDLKPANIIVDGDDLSKATVKVVDFGIAKLDEGSQSAHAVTPHGSVLGTPLYMSPEQISSKEIDARSDIYSTGCILFHLLTGRLPHSGASLMELMQAKLNELPPKINEANKNANVPQGIENVVARSLAVSPDDRFSSMAELKDALTRAAHTLERGAEFPETEPTRLSPRKNTIVAFFLLILLGGVTIVAASRLGQPVSPPQSEKDIELPRTAVFQNNKFTETNDIRSYFFQEKNLTSWNAGNEVSDESVAKLLESKDAPLVEDLELDSQHKLTPQAFKSLAKFPKLQLLTLAESTFNDECAKNLGESRTITKLNLSGTALSDKGLALLTNIPLRDLNIESTNVTNEGMKSIASMKLIRLVATHTKIDNSGLKAISKLPLECLHIELTKVDDQGMKFLSGNKTLRRFYGESTAIGEPGLRQIASCPITELSMAGCPNVDDHCVEFIVTTWPNIVRLDLGDTKISAAGAKYIWKLKGLTELKLNGLELTDDEISPIFELKQLDKITLCKALITDKTLKRIPELKRLKKLELTNCSNVSADAVDSLQASMPRLKIIRPDQDAKMPELMDAFIRGGSDNEGQRDRDNEAQTGSNNKAQPGE